MELLQVVRTNCILDNNKEKIMTSKRKGQKRFSIYLPYNFHLQLKESAQSHGVPMTTYVIKVLSRTFKEERNEKM